VNVGTNSWEDGHASVLHGSGHAKCSPECVRLYNVRNGGPDSSAVDAISEADHDERCDFEVSVGAWARRFFAVAATNRGQDVAKCQQEASEDADVSALADSVDSEANHW